nr:MAG TPA: hypothetical protein [Caudoviricetes sp.]
MERLTKRLTSGVADYDFSEGCYFADGQSNEVAKSAFKQNCLERLADYEDTERGPAEIQALSRLFDYILKGSKSLKEQLAMHIRLRELAEADKDGRVVVLPCKVGELCRDQDTGRVVKITDVRYSMKWEDDTSVTYDYSDGSHGGALWDAFRGHFVRVDTEK